VNFGNKNLRRDTRNRNKWKQLINQQLQVTCVQSNIKNIVMTYKVQADKTRSQESKVKRGMVQEKVTEILIKDSHNYYTCPNCNRLFKPQGITGHVKSCARDWYNKHKIKFK
jgi:uncharacterized protein with PIN domain